MQSPDWGLLGPEKLPSTRRSNMLGLGSAIRMFNERAVPGLGGLFFGKQAFLALLGIEVAQKVRERGIRASNIETANCLEAVGCWLAYDNNDWEPHGCLRGNQKLRNRTVEDFTFARARRLNFYVTQPMRMATVRVLPVLGFVHNTSGRFNQFQCTPVGHDFINEATSDLKPFGSSVTAYLVSRILQQKTIIAPNSKPLFEALSPLEPLSPNAKKILLYKLLENSTDDEVFRQRRLNIWKWLGTLKTPNAITADWKNKPAEIEHVHWEDMKAGARFQNLRDMALDLLQNLENLLDQKGVRKMALADKDIALLDLTNLEKAAQEYRDLDFNCPEATDFALECLAGNPVDVVRALVARDGAGIALSGESIVRGGAFRGSVNRENQTEVSNSATENKSKLPPDISQRVHNMMYLHDEFV